MARFTRITRFIPADTPREELSQHRGSSKVLCTGKHARARAVCLHPRKQSSWNKNAIPQTETAPNPAGFLVTIYVLGAQSRAWILQQTGRSKWTACTGDAVTASLPAGSLGGTRSLQAWLKLGSLLEKLSFPSSSTSGITDKRWGKKRKPTISFITKESWVWTQLVTFFLIQLVTISSTILHLFLAFTTQKEAAIWVKVVQKILYVVESTCTLHQLLQNIWHKWKTSFFSIQY